MQRSRSFVLCLVGSLSAPLAAQEPLVADHIARVEGAQSEPGPNGLGALSVTELMARLMLGSFYHFNFRRTR